MKACDLSSAMNEEAKRPTPTSKDSTENSIRGFNEERSEDGKVLIVIKDRYDPT